MAGMEEFHLLPDHLPTSAPCTGLDSWLERGRISADLLAQHAFRLKHISVFIFALTVSIGTVFFVCKRKWAMMLSSSSFLCFLFALAPQARIVQAIPLNQAMALGSHNSFHLRPDREITGGVDVLYVPNLVNPKKLLPAAHDVARLDAYNLRHVVPRCSSRAVRSSGGHLLYANTGQSACSRNQVALGPGKDSLALVHVHTRNIASCYICAEANFWCVRVRCMLCFTC